MRASRRGVIAAFAASIVVCAFCGTARANASVAAVPAASYEPFRTSTEAAAKRAFDELPSLPPTPNGAVKTFYIFAETKQWEVAPGIVTQAWTYNGTVPGPTIHVRQGDRVRVILVNDLPAPTTIHWHGMTVDPDMDGVPGMSQSAVQPGQSFVYEFTAHDPGTYIYHTHYDDLNQLDRGLYGAVVVDERKPATRYNRDYLMLISSWRILSDTENYFSINGKSYPLTKPYVVKPGDRVRIREIDISGTEFHTMHVHGHRFQVVAVDGQPVAPQNRQSMVTLSLGPGETRDIAFIANAKPGTWMVHCHVLDHLMNGPVGPGGLMTSVQYQNAVDKTGLSATANVMSMSAPQGGGARSGAAPMNQATVYVLGAIAGLTIFFGLPLAVLKRVSRRAMALLNSIAVGVLFFLLFDILRQAGDPIEEALHRVQLGAPRGEFGGLLAIYLIGLAVGILSLVFFSRKFMARTPLGSMHPMTLATMIAAGIGLHNFSEGLAIGQSAATGAIQLALLLIIGFGLHNMTEGFGIAAPLAGSGAAGVGTIVRLGLLGGGPTFVGTIIGYHFVSPLLSVLFLTLAAGAIMYVIGEMTNVGAKIGFKELATLGVFLGFAIGLGTDLILSAAGA